MDLPRIPAYLALPLMLPSGELFAQTAADELVPRTEITVYADLDRGPVRLYTGWLHGFEQNDPYPVNDIYALNTGSWRVSKLWQLDAVELFTDNVQYEVSFSWRWAGLGNPAADLNLWQQYIAGRAQYVVDNDLQVEYWDIWNEPDHSYFWSWSYDDLLLTFDSAIDTIHSIIPDAKIIGPSFAKFVARDNFGNKTVSNFVTDLNAQYGKRLDAVSWHMNDEYIPWNIQGHADDLRIAISWIGGGYDPKLVINEYTQSLIVLRPVYLASFVWHMDQAEIAFSNLACWNLYSSCSPPQTFSSCWTGLNGLFLHDYSAKQHPYWFYLWHGREGGNLRLEVSKPEINTFALASRNDLREEIVACVGRHSHAAGVGVVALSVVNYPFPHQQVQVEVDRLAAAHELCGGDVWKPREVACPDGPTTVSSNLRNVVNGSLTIEFPTFADDDLYFVKIAPPPPRNR